MTSSLLASWSRLNIVQKLIAVNVIVFMVIHLPKVIFRLFMLDIDVYLLSLPWLAVPSGLVNLVTRPWTLFTYMFMHADIWHILFNMLWLFWMGSIFLEYLGPKKLFATYVLGGFAGAFLFILSFNVFPLFSDIVSEPMVGASASVLAITVGIATLIPDYSIRLLLFGNVPLKYLAAGTLAIDLLSISSAHNPGGHISHLGGALFGFFYVRNLKRGKDWTAGFTRLTDRMGSAIQSRSSFRKSSKRARAVSDEEFLHNKKDRQELVDRILDKISKSGYGSLTQREKEILFKSSKEE